MKIAYAGTIFAMLASPSFSTDTDGKARAVPDKPQLNISYSGDIITLGHFTPTQEADPRWEAKRIAMVLAGDNPRRRIIRRDVRWFAPEQAGGEPCARLVYSRQIVGQEGQLTATAHRDEVTRLTLLADEPAAPMEANCGEKDPALSHPPENGAFEREQDAHAATMRVTGSRCEGIKHDPAVSLRIYPRARIWSQTKIDASLSEASSSQTTLDLERLPVGVIARRSWLALRPEPPSIKYGTLTDDGVNILITQRFALLNDGSGYCVELIARQGNRVWSRFVNRPSRVSPRADMFNIMGLSKDPDHYWTPRSDALQLAEELANHLDIPKYTTNL